MPERELKNNDIDRIAAGWAAREDLRPLHRHEAEELESWLRQDVRHLGAYGRAKAVLFRSEEVVSAEGAPEDRRAEKPSSIENSQATARPQPDHMPSVTRRQMMMMCGIGLAVMAVSGGGWLMTTKLFRQSDGQNYHTAHGEIRAIPLEDGSVLTLNTASEIRVDFHKDQRTVYLMKGEAFFKVAKDQSRPFIVHSADRTVRAVGTSFSVRAFEDEVRILVREGRIRFDSPNMPSGGAGLFADANMEIVDKFEEHQPRIRTMDASGLAESLAWLDACLSFNETTLQAAALEFRRYSSTPIILAPGVDHMLITGRYPASDPVGFAEAAAQVLDLRAERTPQGIKLSPRTRM